MYGPKKRIDLAKPISIIAVFIIILVGVSQGLLKFTGNAVIDLNKALIPNTSITSFAVTDSEPNNNKLNNNNNNNNKLNNNNNIAEETKRIYANLSEDNLQIEINNDITITARQIIIEEENIQITTLSNSHVLLKDFKGAAKYQDGKVILTGTLQNYVADNLDIVWKRRKPTVITAQQGMMKTYVSLNLEGDGDGSIRLNDNVYITLEDDKYTMNHFQGELIYDFNAAPRLFLNGNIRNIIVNSDYRLEAR